MSNHRQHLRAKRDLTSGSLNWNLFRLAAPLAARSFLHSLYSLADAFWLGHWSKSALAAQAVCVPFMFIVFALFISFGSAGTALVAQYTGAGDEDSADRSAAQTMLLLAMLGVTLAAPMIAFSRHLLQLVNVPDASLSGAEIYLHIILLGFPLIGFAVAYGAILRALGDTVTVLLISLVGNTVNIVLDPLLIRGMWGLPCLGVGGAALASVTARMVEVLICYGCLRAGRAGLRLSLAHLRPHWATLRKMLRIGLPLAINRSSDSVGFTVFQAMINSLGTTVIGAFTVGFRIIHLFNMPAHAMALAAAPVVGQALGAGKPPLARRAVRSSVYFVAATLFVPLLFLIGFGEHVAAFFVESPEVVTEAGKFFMVVPASSYFFGVLMVLLSAFYGSGHTMPAMAVGIIRLWVLRVPLALLLAFVLGWGSLGMYFAMVIGNVVCALLTLVLFLRGGWEEAVVPTAAGEPREQR